MPDTDDVQRCGVLPVKAAFATLIACAALPSVARADGFDQDSQVMFGVMASYIPQQNNLQSDVAAIGHYVAFSHNIDFVYVGIRLALLYGWSPSGGGQQYLIDPDAFLGVKLKVLTPLTLKLELGTGPLVNGGSGFSTAIIEHGYLRGAAQLRVVKSVSVEAFAGPSLVIGSTVVGAFAEFGLGCGWSF